MTPQSIASKPTVGQTKREYDHPHVRSGLHCGVQVPIPAIVYGRVYCASVADTNKSDITSQILMCSSALGPCTHFTHILFV